MNMLKNILSLIILLTGISAMGQSGCVPGGQFVANESGSINYSIGQCFAVQDLGNDGAVLEGIHQAFGTCDADFNWDWNINMTDMLTLLSEFACEENCDTDLTAEGEVTVLDLLTFLTEFGNLCLPS